VSLCEVLFDNVTPKFTAGKHEVIDKKFTSSGQFKSTEEGETRE
jgi:hypothetical protein